MTVLETTRSMKFIPGSNRKGQVAGANWSFLLPDMRIGTAICLGMPDHKSLQSITRLSQSLLLITGDRISPTVDGISSRIRCITWQAGKKPLKVDLSDGCADLVIIFGKAMIQRVETSSEAQREILRLRKPEGPVYLALDDPLERLTAKNAVERLANAFGKAQRYWATPLNGEVHTAVPLGDADTIRFFLKGGFSQPGTKKWALQKAKRRVERVLYGAPLTRRESILVAPKGTVNGAPPRYLTDLAAQSGLNLEDYRWGMVAHGEYASRKVLFYLFAPGNSQPAYIVKLVRDPALNGRLENEYRALTALSGRESLGRFIPTPVFFGYHNDQAVLCQQAVPGEDFQRKTDYSVRCTHLQSAVQQLTALAVETVESRSHGSGGAVEALEDLYRQFAGIYPLTGEEQSFLEKQIERIGSTEPSFPTVFQHGDPGVWNMLVTPEGRVVFLDWEAAEAQGAPLWDLFYFLRSYAVRRARKAGERDSLRAFSSQFLADGEFSQYVMKSLRCYWQKTGLLPALTGPLFYTCWMHRALKESTRLAPANVEQGNYFRLLRFCIQQRNTKPIERLLSTGL